MKSKLLTFLAVLALVSCSLPQRHSESDSKFADLILFNGKILTLDGQTHQFDSVAIQKNKILYVGTTSGALRFTGSNTKLIDVQGRTIMPGFDDAHTHLLWQGGLFLQLDLKGLDRPEKVADRVRQKAKTVKPGEWIQGFGWDQNLWPGKQFPSKKLIDSFTPENPVFLRRVDGHACWVNSVLLKRIGIDKNTPDPEGGKIVRDANGEPTGVLLDKATGMVTKIVPPLTPEENQKALELASREAFRNGVTSVHQLMVSVADIEFFKNYLRAGLKAPRSYLFLNSLDPANLEYAFSHAPEIGLFENFLTIRGIKLFADGALGSRGAGLLEPYSDDPGNSGLETLPPDKMHELVLKAHDHGYQVAIHAIGDRAVREALQVFSRVEEERPDFRNTRPRIEHAAVVRPEDIPLFAQLGVIASFQTTHCTSDLSWAQDRLGKKRAKREAYPWRSLLDAHVKVANGTDTPVEPINPFYGVYSGITRQDSRGFPKAGWYPGQRMTREEVLWAYTSGSAYAAFEENLKGTIEPGKLADLIVVSGDLLKESPKTLRKTKVWMTLLDGEIVYHQD